MSSYFCDSRSDKLNGEGCKKCACTKSRKKAGDFLTRFEEEDSRTGKREEGAGTIITLQNQILKYDYVVKNIHPDILGLICLANFFPFIGKNVEFPMPVSPRLVEGFRNPIFLEKKELNFVNVDPNIPKYSGKKTSLIFFIILL